MDIYEILKTELDRVVMKGNPDKTTIQQFAAIIWELDRRIMALETGKPATVESPVEEPVATFKPTTKPDPAVAAAAKTKTAAAKPRSRRAAKKPA